MILIWDFATGAMICLVSEKSHGACPRTETTKFLHRLLQDKTTERNLVRPPARLLLSDYSFIYFCVLRVSISYVSIAQRRLCYLELLLWNDKHNYFPGQEREDDISLPG